ncbi:class I SAM-dependent DNA methyltransferase [Anaerostipes sp. MSJ-23]|uniref:class I SAM-dependent DNA methyltransferase n=1 Tax=Anaerostipes sp. MSJ-23 TaxID=2841520 RepID=UPI001C128E3E|nr:class I SAM-dependent methyltransferase [Anaerostipes sp. MSJ-23]MBU5460382.1 class I SAM-dependent methyltransferase [Anaerostipes sp. MSJ-23]
MESYTEFARVYDEFMDQTPYDLWCDNLLTILKKHHMKENGSILELGCGTGKMTRRLAKKGYQMTGLDSSLEMLEVAGNMQEDDILYILQDMVSMEMPGKFDAVVSVCDCMNYILEEEDLKMVFQKVRSYLKEEGVFIFDMNAPYKYEKLLSQNTFAEDREDASFIWDNFYDEQERINEYQLSLFIKNAEGTYDKYEEEHYQKAYDAKKISQMLENAGFSKVTILDVDTMKEPVQKTERFYFIAL